MATWKEMYKYSLHVSTKQNRIKELKEEMYKESRCIYVELEKMSKRGEGPMKYLINQLRGYLLMIYMKTNDTYSNEINRHDNEKSFLLDIVDSYENIFDDKFQITLNKYLGTIHYVYAHIMYDLSDSQSIYFDNIEFIRLFVRDSINEICNLMYIEFSESI